MTAESSNARRRATIRTDHGTPATVAAAVRPDNTGEMATHVESGTVVTAIARETTGGLRSTVDDYVVNVDVAAAVIGSAAQFERKTTDTTQTTDTNGYSESERQ